jgi:predicted dehydrogenase
MMSMADPRALWLATGEDGHNPAKRWKRVEIPKSDWKLPGAPRKLNDGDVRWSYRYDQAFQFVQAIRGEEAAQPTFEAGYRTQQVLDAALKSAQSGQWESVR